MALCKHWIASATYKQRKLHIALIHKETWYYYSSNNITSQKANFTIRVSFSVAVSRINVLSGSFMFTSQIKTCLSGFRKCVTGHYGFENIYNVIWKHATVTYKPYCIIIQNNSFSFVYIILGKLVTAQKLIVKDECYSTISQRLQCKLSLPTEYLRPCN